jgi:hypothetical protein
MREVFARCGSSLRGCSRGNGSNAPTGLDALRDGFEFADTPQRRSVLSLEHVDVLWDLDASWTAGLLAIASEHSRVQFALGRRFFALLALHESSVLVGTRFDSLAIPYFGWDPKKSAPVAG